MSQINAGKMMIYGRKSLPSISRFGTAAFKGSTQNSLRGPVEIIFGLDDLDVFLRYNGIKKQRSDKLGRKVVRRKNRRKEEKKQRREEE